MVPVFLVILAVGAGVYTWRIDRGTVSDGELRAREGRMLPVFRRGDLTSVTVTLRGGAPFRLRRDDAPDGSGTTHTWSEGSPSDVVLRAAERPAVDRLLSELDGANVLRRVTDGAPIPDADPVATLALVAGTRTTTIDVLGDAPTPAGAVYVRVDRGAVVVVPAATARVLLAPGDAYRDRNLVPEGALPPVSLVLHGGDLTETWSRVGPEAYVSDRSRLRVLRSESDDLVAALGALRAESFLDAAAGERSTAARVHTVSWTSGGPPVAVAFGPPCVDPKSAATFRWSPSALAACVATGTIDRIAPRNDRAGDRRAFTLRDDQVEELEFTRASDREVVRFVRSGAGFERRGGSVPVGAPDAGDDVLRRLVHDVVAFETTLRWTPATDGSSAADRNGHDRVRVVRADHLGEEVVWTRREAASRSFVREQDGASVSVPTSSAEAFADLERAVR
ncbi:MAG: hypothetical protein U0169_14935 [Polyangiaceae bacterium]